MAVEKKLPKEIDVKSLSPIRVVATTLLYHNHHRIRAGETFDLVPKFGKDPATGKKVVAKTPGQQFNPKAMKLAHAGAQLAEEDDEYEVAVPGVPSKKAIKTAKKKAALVAGGAEGSLATPHTSDAPTGDADVI